MSPPLIFFLKNWCLNFSMKLYFPKSISHNGQSCKILDLNLRRLKKYCNYKMSLFWNFIRINGTINCTKYPINWVLNIKWVQKCDIPILLFHSGNFKTKIGIIGQFFWILAIFSLIFHEISWIWPLFSIKGHKSGKNRQI